MVTRREFVEGLAVSVVSLTGYNRKELYADRSVPTIA